MKGVVRASRRAFTLVELMVVVAIIGILAAVAIPAFNRYIRKSRTTEAIGQLSRLHAGAVSYYDADHTDSNNMTLPKQFPGNGGGGWYDDIGSFGHCGCRQGGKCAGSPPKFDKITFETLHFQLADPHSYTPFFQATGSGNGALYSARVYGDLDCDSTLAQFLRRGSIDPVTKNVSSSIGGVSVFELE